MKKAKLFLTGVAVVALVGTTMAYKAHARNIQNLFYCDPTDNTCELSIYNNVSGVQQSLPVTEYYTVGQEGQTCTTSSCHTNPSKIFLND